MVRAAHLACFFQAGDERVRRHPDAQAQQKDDQHGHDRLSILHLRSRNAMGDAQPEIIIRSQEQHADQHRLQNKQPGQESAHQRDAHLLVVLINFTHQPIAGEGQRKQSEHADKIADVAHPIVMVAFFRRRGG